MSGVQCPYCEASYDTDEMYDGEYEVQCGSCEKEFTITAEPTIKYSVTIIQGQDPSADLDELYYTFELSVAAFRNQMLGTSKFNMSERTYNRAKQEVIDKIKELVRLSKLTEIKDFYFNPIDNKKAWSYDG